jgi:hypothetical protein
MFIYTYFTIKTNKLRGPLSLCRFKHILISLANFMGTTNSVRILYNATLLPESWDYLKPIKG